MRSFSKLLAAVAALFASAALVAPASAATVTYDLSVATCSLTVSECTTASGVFLESPGNTMVDFPGFFVGIQAGSDLYFTAPSAFDSIVDLTLIANGSPFGQPYAFEVYNANDVLVDTAIFPSVNGGNTFSITNVALGIISDTFYIRNIAAGVTIGGVSLTVGDTVPLPSALSLMAAGVGGLGWWRARRRTAKA